MSRSAGESPPRHRQSSSVLSADHALSGHPAKRKLFAFAALGSVLRFLLAPVVMPLQYASKQLTRSFRAPGATWREDSLEVTWFGTISPYAVPWATWVAAVLSLATVFYMALPLVVGGLIYWQVVPWERLLEPAIPALLGGFTACSSIGATGWLRTAYSLTISHSTLKIDRPLRRPLELDLSEVDQIEVTDWEVVVHLRDGTYHVLPGMKDRGTAAQLRDLVADSKLQLLEHRSGIDQADEQRRSLEELLVVRQQTAQGSRGSR